MDCAPLASACRASLVQAAADLSGRAPGIYLPSGLIPCGHCGKGCRVHSQARGRAVAYDLCGGYPDSGLAVCDLRIPQSYLDEAVLDGIQQRLDLILDREG